MRHCRLLALVLVLGFVLPVAPAGLAAAHVDAAERTSPASVDGTSYTSPQFGFRVNWETPWSLAQEPVSKAGQYDALSLMAGEIAIDYAGIVTALDPAAFFRGAVAVRRQQFPDLAVVQPYLPVSPRLPGILNYSAHGGQMIDLVYLQPLTQGQSLLMIAESFPADTSEALRKQADGAVHLESSSLPGSARSNSTLPSIDPQALVTRLLQTPLSTSELPSGYEVHGVAKTGAEETDAQVIGRVEVELQSGLGPRALVYIVYPADADAQQAYSAWLVDTRIHVGGTFTPVTGLADEAALIVVPGSEAADSILATAASVLIRQGNVLIFASVSNRNVLDPAAPRTAAFALAQAGLAHLQRVLTTGSSSGVFEFE